MLPHMRNEPLNCKTKSDIEDVFSTCEYFHVSFLRQLLMEHVIVNEMVGAGKTSLLFVPDDVLCSFECHNSSSGSWTVFGESEIWATILYLHEQSTS